MLGSSRLLPAQGVSDYDGGSPNLQGEHPGLSCSFLHYSLAALEVDGIEIQEAFGSALYPRACGCCFETPPLPVWHGQLRQHGTPIVSVCDEMWVNQHNSRARSWEDRAADPRAESYRAHSHLGANQGGGCGEKQNCSTKLRR